MNTKKIVLTGDRPTGPLHLGHYVGSLQNRLKLQHEHKQYVMVADVQALASNTQSPEKLRENVLEVLLDYLAVGIDPELTTIFIQSMIPQIAELTIFYLNFVTVAQLQRNPTIKEEVVQRGYGANIPAGFLVHPVNQAADITIVNADYVPVGQDQVPLIEQCLDVVRALNRTYGNIITEPKALVPEIGGRLAGLDGKAKMSKSLGNAIYLSDPADELKKKVMSMYTDPNHARVEDPGTVEGNMVFAYLDIFDPNKAEVEELKAHYRRGGLGDVAIKRRLLDILEAFLAPMRERRAQFAKDPAAVMAIAHKGTEATRIVAQQTMERIKQAMKIDYF
jgi:tryptophanyl-tRNA synthetase